MRNSRVVWLCLSAGLSGMLGCGDNVDSGSDAGSALQLVRTAPTALGTDVPVDIVITAEFDAQLNAATVTTSSFRLSRDGGADVPGSVTVSGQTATFTPTLALERLSSYTATLTTEIKSAAGQALGVSQSWSFRTQDRRWGDATLIEVTNAGAAVNSQVAVDPDGNAIAVWAQSDGMRYNILANRFTPGAGWSAPELLESDNAGDASLPQVALDPSGNAVAVWYQYDGAHYNIWANRFTRAAGWGTAQLIESDNAGVALNPQVALDANGNAIAVWSQGNGTRYSIRANRFTPGGGWGAAQLIETNASGDATDTQVALDANGNAIAVWSQGDGTRDNIWANRYTPAAGWGAPQLLEANNAGSAWLPQVALDPAGNAVAVWSQDDGTRDNIWANRYTPAAGWGGAELVESDNTGYAADPQVALDSSGNAIAVWYQGDGTRNNLWANRFVPAAGWGAAVLIEQDNAGSTSAPQVALDSDGNGVAVWEQSDGARSNIWSNRFLPATGWGTAVLIEQDNAGSASTPQVALDSFGNGVAVWQQLDGTRSNIWANRFE